MKKSCENFIRTHEKKLRHLTKNKPLLFTESDIITNLSSYVLGEEEKDILKHGLSFALPPSHLKKSEIFTTFENISKYFQENLIDKKNSPQLKSQLSHLADCYFYNYHPSLSTRKKYATLKKLKDNNHLVITRPDKGNGVVLIDKSKYEEEIRKIIQDQSKFKKLKEDPTKKKENKLKEFLKELKKDNFLNE